MTDFTRFALDLTESCYYVYNHTASGLGPSNWAWNETYDPDAHQRGFVVEGSSYNAYPETIESIFYAWKITGDTRYRDMNAQIWNNLLAITPDKDKSNKVYGTLEDVDDSRSITGSLQSYFFAESECSHSLHWGSAHDWNNVCVFPDLLLTIDSTEILVFDLRRSKNYESGRVGFQHRRSSSETWLQLHKVRMSHGWVLLVRLRLALLGVDCCVGSLRPGFVSELTSCLNSLQAYLQI